MTEKVARNDTFLQVLNFMQLFLGSIVPFRSAVPQRPIQTTFAHASKQGEMP